MARVCVFGSGHGEESSGSPKFRSVRKACSGNVGVLEFSKPISIWEEGRMRGGLAHQAITFVHNFKAIKETSEGCPSGSTQQIWEPPSEGLMKVNFDAGMVVGDGRGWGFTVRDKNGDIIIAGVNQNVGFQEAELEEVRECLIAIKIALAQGFKRIMMEGDCLASFSSCSIRKGLIICLVFLFQTF